MDDELEAYEDAGDVAVESKLDEIIPQIVGMVRGSVSSCVNVTELGAEGEIPDELLWAASTLARRSLISVLTGLDDSHSEIRKSEDSRAERMLDRAADCKLAVSKPNSIDPTVRPSAYGGDDKLDF